MKKVKKILFIDDDAAANFIHQNITENEGYADTVVTMTSGKSALDYLAEHIDSLPDLIFVDLNMPGMGGFEFMKAFDDFMKSISKGHDEELPFIFVAMLTTSILAEHRLKTKNYKWLKMHITKPLTKNHFDEIFSQIG